MSLNVFAVVMAAALLHAAWNALLKSAPDKLPATIMVAAAAATLAGVLLPFLTPPARASWPYAALSIVFHRAALAAQLKVR